ncbi:unnamed protein product [Aphanomyces euteiches]|uniref:Uncharacterized protein n=1 Tax=Aphanomyces euteiches TaxID=100861 RepID=A0A6G0XDN5_9STRA|nr:hypothetical protein Ae201684_006144 [Aphanomyces euteiches]KAH9069053.1 hypothetical protein Ae201684P_004749 [Aphanomyces euteiches]
MKRKELLAACESLVGSYDPALMTLDAHVDETLQDVGEADRLFLHQVLYGCVRYKDVLNAFLTNFYQANSAKVSRNDYTKFLVLAYLAIFRLDDIGMSAFQGFVSSQNPTAMHVLLSFLFDETAMKAIETEWMRLLDQDYVQSQLVDKLAKHKPAMEQVLEKLHAKAFGLAAARETLKKNGGVVRIASKEPTIPVSPNITQPRPKAVPEPIRIPIESHAHPVPDLNKLTLADIDVQQKKRLELIKDQVVKKYEATPQFQLEETKSKLEEIRKQVEDERMAELKNQFKAKPAPNFTHTDAPVKLNTAAILREDALYKKKQDKEAKLIQAYESDLRDASEFYRWQSEMVKRDQENRRQEVERRRLEMVQAQHEAIEASLRAKAENRQVAIQMKLVSKENDEKRRLEEQQIDMANRMVATEIKQVRQVAPREAEERIKLENQKKRDAVHALLEQERARKAEQDAIEQAQREDLIRQIRALDRVHREHVAIFDPTESSNCGLLEEMSLVELRERLELRRIEQAEEEAQKREQILGEKKEKEADLKARVSNISRIRQLAAVSNRTSRERRKQLEREKAEREKQLRDEGNLKLAQKMAAQRKERDAEFQRLKEEEQLIANKRMFLGAAKNMLEERHFMQQTMGAERQASDRQCAIQEEARVVQATKHTEKKVRREFHHKEALAKAAALHANDQAIEKATAETKDRLRHDKDTRKAGVRHEKNRKLHANQILQHRNVYATHISAVDVDHGRSFRASNQHDT